MRDSWNVGELGDFVDKIVGGGTPSKNVEKYWDGNIPWASVKDFEDNKFKIKNTQDHISQDGLRNSSASLIPPGIPVMCTRMAVGRVAISPISLAINQDLKAFYPSKELDISYFLVLLWFLKGKFESKAIGSTVKGISLKDINTIIIRFPKSLPQQQKIAKILSTCDAVIEKTEAAITKYQALKQGMMHDLFTRGIDVKTGKLRPRFEDAPELYKESELGMIPNEWEVKRLELLIDAVDPQPDHRTPSSVENGIPYLGINDIDHLGYVNYDRCRRVSLEVLNEHTNRYTVKDGDIIFGKIGTIGQPKRLMNFKDLTLSANVILIQPKKNPDFIFWLLNSSIVTTTMNNTVHTTSQPAFGMEKIRSLLVPLCNETEQIAILESLNSLQNKISTEQSTLSKYQQLKAGLMQDLLTGKVEVSAD